LLSSTSGALALANRLSGGNVSKQARDEALAKAALSPTAEIRDLFERFLPEEQRTRRLGSAVDPAEILALAGDVEAGRKIFFETEAVRCRSCHQIADKGIAIGPDLSKIGKQYTQAQLLEAILEPSKKIDPKFLAYTIENDAGQIYSGLLVEKNADSVVIKDAKNEIVRIPAADVVSLTPSPKSLMPDLLLRDLTAQNVADLTAFLGSLK
jgi:putative heme-binding domain-containing protein